MSAHSIDQFFQSTCVLVVFAYLLTRWPLSSLSDASAALSRKRWRVWLEQSAILGAIGLAELYFVQDRFPYDTYTLIVTFASLRAGGWVGLATAALMAAGAPLFLSAEALEPALASIFGGVLCGLFVRRLIAADWSTSTGRLAGGSLLAMLLAESVAIAARLLLPHHAAPFSLSVGVLRLCANGAGIVLLQMIVRDAESRRMGQKLLLEAQRNKTLLAQAQLSALRARIHPHFLFNALNSIAALCRLAPEKAEAATVQLAQIMRRALEESGERQTTLADELESVAGYLGIERLRLAERLRVIWEIDRVCDSAILPPFALQTLVENAILHGISPRIEPGAVIIRARRHHGFIAVLVHDNGAGMEMDRFRREPRADSSHGLLLAAAQLELLHGRQARLRLFSSPGCGTIAAFRLPLPGEIPAGAAAGTLEP